MTASPFERAEHARMQAELVRALADTIRALLDGRMDRADALEWTRELWPSGNPFTSMLAEIVYDSVFNLDRLDDGGEVVRDVDLRAYLRWLTEGDGFDPDREPLIVLARDIDDLAAQTGTETIRWCQEGLGWQSVLRFAASASGRPFVANAQLGRSRVAIHKQRSDDYYDAIVDLFETLAIDDADAMYIHPSVGLGRLPAWILWRQDDNGNRFEVARLRSYAKACAQERMFTARGHKQNYWVEPAKT